MKEIRITSRLNYNRFVEDALSSYKRTLNTNSLSPYKVSKYITKIKKDKTYKPNTIYTHTMALLRFFREYYTHKPNGKQLEKYENIIKLHRIKRPGKVHSNESIFTPDQFVALVQFVSIYNVKYAIIMMVFFYTGLRIEEFVSVRLSDVKILNTEDAEINIKNGKGNRERYTICPTFVIELAKSLNPKMYLFESSDFRKYSKRRVQTICREAGRKFGKKLTPHLLRHSFATAHMDNGTNPEILAKLMGNSVLTILKTYNHPKQDTAKLNQVLVNKTQKLLGRKYGL